MYKIGKLTSELTLDEQGKSQMKVGDAREFISKLSDRLVSPDGVAIMECLIANGRRRQKEKQNKANPSTGGEGGQS